MFADMNNEDAKKPSQADVPEHLIEEDYETRPMGGTWLLGGCLFALLVLALGLGCLALWWWLARS